MAFHHPLELLRPTLSDRRMAHSRKLREEARNGDFLQMAGLVLVRQRPGTASGREPDSQTQA